MQANNVNHAVKRVSSDEIKRNYTQITGEEAVMRLFAGERVFDGDGWSWQITDGKLRFVNESQTPKPSSILFNVFLEPENDWYIAPPFDARKEMLARPGEWVAKYTEDGVTRYVGFDAYEMIAVKSETLWKEVDWAETFAVSGDHIDQAIPLDDADLAKLAALKADEVSE